MISAFTVRTNSRYDRLAKTLRRRAIPSSSRTIGRRSRSLRPTRTTNPDRTTSRNWRAYPKVMASIGSRSGAGDFVRYLRTAVLLSYCGLRRESTVLTLRINTTLACRGNCLIAIYGNSRFAASDRLPESVDRRYFCSSFSPSTSRMSCGLRGPSMSGSPTLTRSPS